MPSFSKKVLSLFLRTGCQRQFHLYLYNDDERTELGMPPRQKARSQVGEIGRAGYKWQDEKVSELDRIFGNDAVIIKPNPGGKRPHKIDLLTILPIVKPFQFLVESEYDANSDVFRRAVGFEEIRDLHGKGLNIGKSNPDIIQTLPPVAFGPLPVPMSIREYNTQVLPDGSLEELPPEDARIRLRVIDIKLASDPGAYYFAEVVYYSMTLSAWLIQNKLDDRFVVVATPAVWPGSYDASVLSSTFEMWRRQGVEPSSAQLAAALEDDIEIAPVDAFAPRLRRLLREQIKIILQTPWHDLRPHVDFNCQGCEFLGYPWLDKNKQPTNDQRHCWPTSEREKDLSQVAGLTKGSSKHLSTHEGIKTVTDLAQLHSEHKAFSSHQGLRAKRTIFPSRANALLSKTTQVIPDSGGDALMPRWPNLRLFVFVDYDLSSAITVSFGLLSYWKEPLPFGSKLEPRRKKWTRRTGNQDVFIVDRRDDITRERQEFLNFLRGIKAILGKVREEDAKACQEGRRNLDDGQLDQNSEVSNYQIYLWDDAQKRHLTRLVGRHLTAILADPELRDLAWLFPPPELLARPEQSSRQSPITLVSTVIQNTLAAPVPHHYTLLNIVDTFKPDLLKAPSVHPLYQEPLTDLIPGERIHEYWNKRGRWLDTEKTIEETTRKKALALAMVTWRVERELDKRLATPRLTAPPIYKLPRRPPGLSPHGRLWYEFTRLNQTLEALEAHTTNAMPPHEREVKFKSAILERRLQGNEKESALQKLRLITGQVLTQSSDYFVYTLFPSSVDVNARDGDLGYALSPLDEPNFLDEHPFHRLTYDTNIRGKEKAPSIGHSGLTGVSIAAIDRTNALIALKPGFFNKIAELEFLERIDLFRNVVLDRVPEDLLSKKVLVSLQAVGYPQSARADQRVLEALGDAGSPPKTFTQETPASIFLWRPLELYSQIDDVESDHLRDELIASNIRLNPSQWKAWDAAMRRRLSLIWGPPGTGKSWTLRAVILAAVLNAIIKGKPLRILITSGTYVAVDNVLLGVDRMLSQLLPERPASLLRLQSSYRPVPIKLAQDHPSIQNLVFSKHNTPQAIIDLQEELTNPTRISIIGAPAQQIHNLAVARKGRADESARKALRDWFDLIVLDEASQVDVATSTLIITKMSKEGRVVVAGDDRQLPPIHQAEAPKDLEYMVGSVYNYLRHYHDISPTPLQINYRSNETLIAFTRSAGYDPDLTSYSPDLQLDLLSDLPTTRPKDWPATLHWSQEYNYLLSPRFPATCFIYDDELSSQVNEFEANAIAAILRLLFKRLSNQLLNERSKEDPMKFIDPSLIPYNSIDFWTKAVGVVTPHRAQQSKIVQRLQEIFEGHPADKIREAVDTVERFQGQERDLIVASFGLGDPDLIRYEDEFLYSLNRFNVLTSRARAKLIVFTTRSLVEHLSNDSDVLQESRLLKLFAETFCQNPQPLTLGHLRNGKLEEKLGVIRHRLIRFYAPDCSSS